MAYTAEISRSNPTCFLFLVDQSGSMGDQILSGELPTSKAAIVADTLNRLLAELSIKCAKEEGVRDYFHISVLGYGASVGPALTGVLSGREIVPLSEVASNPARVERRSKKSPDGAGGLIEQQVKFPVWVDAVANGGTPMAAALARAKGLIESWLTVHPNGFPPIVMNLTDGESTDGDPTAPAEAVKELCSSDGKVLLFNLHVSSHAGVAIRFPDSDGVLADKYAKTLFGMSSLLPPQMRSYAAQIGFQVSDGTRGFVFNADATDVVRFLEIGTRLSNLR